MNLDYIRPGIGLSTGIAGVVASPRASRAIPAGYHEWVCRGGTVICILPLAIDPTSRTSRSHRAPFRDGSPGRRNGFEPFYRALIGGHASQSRSGGISNQLALLLQWEQSTDPSIETVSRYSSDPR